MKRVLLFLSIMASMLWSASISSSTGIVATDVNGKTWDIDALLDAGKHIVIHQTFSG